MIINTVLDLVRNLEDRFSHDAAVMSGLIGASKFSTKSIQNTCIIPTMKVSDMA